MNKIQKILDIMAGDPTPWEVYAYQKEWTQDELDILMEAEALLKVPELSLQLQRPESAIIAKYFELRSELDGQVALDVQIMSSDDISWQDFLALPYTLDDLIQDVTLIDAKVGDYVRVNVRTLIPFSPDENVATFHRSTAGCISGHGMGADKVNPDYWAYIYAEVEGTGNFNLGTKITGMKRSVLFNVSE